MSRPSFKDLLTADERREARERGWELCEVWDTAKRNLRVMVLPTENNVVKSQPLLMQVLMMRARAGDPLATKLIKVSMHEL